MKNVFEFLAESRALKGRSEARGLRRNGKVPAVLYGGSREPVWLVLDHNEVVKRLNHEAVYSHVLDLKVDGQSEKAILKEIQRNPARPQVLHMDFMRVSDKDKIRVHVPVHFINEATSVGVKKGGVVTHNLVDIEVSCLPTALPEYIEVDIEAVDIGESVHLSDIVLPEGVEIIELSHGESHDLSVVTIVQAKGVAATDEDADESEEDVAE